MNIAVFFGRAWRWARWPLLVVILGYVALATWGVFLRFDMDKTDAAVAQIHAQKITLADVMGDTLIKIPDQAENDATVAGLDTNNNGIRDDVEIAIFKKYPNSAKIRAAELQYAMAEQMYLTRVFNTGTWKAVAEEVSRAHLCVLEVGANRKEVEAWTSNTQLRKETRTKAFEFITTHGDAPGKPCDVDISTLPN